MQIVMMCCDVQAAGCWDHSRRISRSSGSGVPSSSQGNSARGSQEELLVLAGARAKERSAWSNMTGHAAAATALATNWHSLLLLPLSVLRHGGLAFLGLYTGLLVILGAPLVLAEMFLGQYSGLSAVHIFTNMCPLLSGLGGAMFVTIILRSVMNISLMVWVSRALYDIFTLFDTDTGMETVKEVVTLQHSTPTSAALFSLEYSELITLAVVIILLFLLGLGGVRAIGRISQLSVMSSFLLLITLTIRCCLTVSGSEAVTSLLSPDWLQLSRPLVWLEAVVQVMYSLYLGLGVISTYSSHNSYSHNIVRDALLVVAGHWTWIVLSSILLASILGMAGVEVTDSLGEMTAMDCMVTASEAMGRVSQGWLWLGLLLILVLVISLTTTLGYITLIVSILPRFKRAVATPISLSLLFFLSLVLCNEAGPSLYLHITASKLTTWPPLLYSLLTVLALAWCHDLRYLEADLTSVTSSLLPHLVTSHLASLLYTTIPASLAASLYLILSRLASSNIYYLVTTILPLAPTLVGACFMTLRALRNYPRIVVSNEASVANICCHLLSVKMTIPDLLWTTICL